MAGSELCGAKDALIRRSPDSESAVTAMAGSPMVLADGPHGGAAGDKTTAKQRASSCSDGVCSVDQQPEMSRVHYSSTPKQQPGMSRTVCSGAPKAAAHQPHRRCRYCAAHGDQSAMRANHRASCWYYQHCPCFICRQVHLMNSI